MTSICLNMIVKNEAHVISQTLTNLLNYLPISYWVIADTGSTDETKTIIRTFFEQKEIPGELLEHEWINFGHNRQQALDAARGKADYVFFFDADDYIEGELPLTELTERGYYFILQDEESPIQYHRPLLVKNDGSFYWRGVLHEYLIDSLGESFTIIEGGYRVRSCRTGGRSLDPDKYKKDALVLEQAIADGVDPDLTDRYMFYAAQSWMAAGDSDRGVYWYHKRTETGGWDQELSLSHYRLGEHYAGQNDQPRAIYHWLCASEAYPQAAESWYQLSRLNSWNNRHQVAYHFAKQAVAVVEAKKQTYMFEHKDIHHYWAYYELFVNAFYKGELEESYTAFKNLVWRRAPSWLYANELDKLNHFGHLAHQDSYLEVTRLKHELQHLGLSEVIACLGI